MAWVSLLSCRALPHYLISRTLLAPLSGGTLRILCDSSPFPRSHTSARQMFSTSTAKLDVIEVSTTITDVDKSAMCSAIIQAIHELPIMTKDGVGGYAEKCFAESQELCQQDQSWSATVPWLKGFISGIVYPNDDIQQHEKAADAHCTLPKLRMVHEFMHSILSQLSEHDEPNQSVYNLGIVHQYLDLLEHEENRDNLWTKLRAFARGIDLNNVDSSNRLDIERSDIPLFNSLYVQFRKLTDGHENKIGLTGDILQAEIRKGCILLFTGQEGRHAAARFFFSALRCIVALESDSIGHYELLFVYQKRLPEAVFARVLTISQVHSQTFLIDYRLRDALFQTISEMPLLTRDTFETYSQEQFEEVKQLRVQGRRHDPATAVLWLKGFFSRILYTKDIDAPEKLGHEFATTTTLQRYASGAHEVLRKLCLEFHTEAPNSASPYTRGILSHFNKILQDAKRGIERGDLEAKYSATIKNIKFHDMSGERVEELRMLGSQTFNQFRSNMAKLVGATPESNIIEIMLLMKLVELRKACILIIAGGDCIPRALPYLASTYYDTVAIWSPQVGLFLLYAYQHVLPPGLFEKTIQFIWLFLHTENSEEWTAGLSLPNPRMHEKEQSATLQVQRDT